MNHHPFAIDVADFQVGQFRASYSGGVERHQQSAMEGSAGRLNELSNFFLAEDRWQVMGPFRIGSVGDAPDELKRENPNRCNLFPERRNPTSGYWEDFSDFSTNQG